jgi:hypothetical protein
MVKYDGVDLQIRPANGKQRPVALTNKEQDTVI